METTVNLVQIWSIIIVSLMSVVTVCMGIVALNQQKLLNGANKHIRDFVLVSLAMKASSEIHPSSGPAILQQLSKMQVPPVDNREEQNNAKPQKTGVTIRQGTN